MVGTGTCGRGGVECSRRAEQAGWPEWRISFQQEYEVKREGRLGSPLKMLNCPTSESSATQVTQGRWQRVVARDSAPDAFLRGTVTGKLPAQGDEAPTGAEAGAPLPRCPSLCSEGDLPKEPHPGLASRHHPAALPLQPAAQHYHLLVDR